MPFYFGLVKTNNRLNIHTNSIELLVAKKLNGSIRCIIGVLRYPTDTTVCVPLCTPQQTESFSSDSALFLYDDLGFTALLVDSNVIMVKVLTNGMNPGGTSEALLVCWQSGRKNALRTAPEHRASLTDCYSI